MSASSEAPAICRSYVADVAAQHGLPIDLSQDLVLIVSEVVSSAVEHCGPTGIVLTLDVGPRRVRVEVTHDGLGRPDHEADGGIGLRVIEAVAARWGHETRDTGEVVWFDLATR